jgi:glycerate dehydrogenase
VKSAFLDFDSLGPADLDTSGLTDLLPGIALYPWTAAGDVAARIADRQILLVNKVRLHRELLHAAPALRLVCLAATGTDNVDVQAARERGVAVCNIRNYGTPSVVQHVFGLLLALTLRLPEYQALVAAGAWQRSRQFCLLDHPVRELQRRRFGIVGYGQLGRAVGEVARALGMEVVACRSLRDAGKGETGGEVRRLPLPELLRTADVVSLHCPLTPATAQLINAQSLALMRPDAVLLNTARGGLVEGTALVAALRHGRLGGAGIDVLPEEPPVAGDPLLEAGLPNLIVTPHVAWAARESRQRALDEVIANVRDFLAGGRRNRVD